MDEQQRRQIRIPRAQGGLGLRLVDELAPLAYVAQHAEVAEFVVKALRSIELEPVPPYGIQDCLNRVCNLAEGFPQVATVQRDPVLPLEAVVMKRAEHFWSFYAEANTEGSPLAMYSRNV